MGVIYGKTRAATPAKNVPAAAAPKAPAKEPVPGKGKARGGKGKALAALAAALGLSLSAQALPRMLTEEYALPVGDEPIKAGVPVSIWTNGLAYATCSTNKTFSTTARGVSVTDAPAGGRVVVAAGIYGFPKPADFPPQAVWGASVVGYTNGVPRLTPYCATSNRVGEAFLDDGDTVWVKVGL